MELQLGLALPTIPSKLLDLNSRTYDPFNHKKRTFSQLSEHAPETTHTPTHVMLPTLSLLPLTPSRSNHDHQHPIHTKDDEEDVEALVGWPPVNFWRKKLRFDNYGEEVAGNDHTVWIDHHQNGHGHGRGSVALRGSHTLYVKVKMEGVGIARKIDLSMHQSFQTLKETLMDMFGKCHQPSGGYELAYQDKEGDWLLAEDVPWRSFVQCARRLKLLKRIR
ncbi:auxin-responsive protein IAA29-like [Abrus precatorius]|uniref:Auxin-induced protein n=1 Tax=Abrus precatorius TaxID=3816 RepID=A0A8B8JPJ3_ABRPR|nr:auxin-responsive protein IAA29-like [Abrus precatorius]